MTQSQLASARPRPQTRALDARVDASAGPGLRNALARLSPAVHQPALQKSTHQAGNRVTFLFERKMPRVEEVEFCVLQIPLDG